MKLEKPHRLRVVLLGAAFLFLASLVSARLYHLQYLNHEHYSQRADRQHFKRVVLQPERGDILDRAGRPLAHSTGRMTVYIHPRFLTAPEFEGNAEMLRASLALESGHSPAAIDRLLSGSAPTALSRRVRKEQAIRVLSALEANRVDGRGYWLHRESIRLYPRHLAASVIGFCQMDGDGDNEGLAGLELVYNEQLRGTRITGRSLRSGISQTLQGSELDDVLAARGNTLVLTIDAMVQEEIEDILAKTVEEFSADSGGIVVMDVRTGGIVAMASYPTFDNNQFSSANPASMRNRLLTDPLETGSVAKLFTAAILMDRGYVTPETLVDCEAGAAVVDGRRLRDSPGPVLRVVSFREAMRWSSNVGIVKAGQLLENREWYDYYRALGFGAPTGIDLPGEGSGILYPVERWTRFSRTSLPMGYEMALTPVQIAAALSALVNGGNYFQPHVVSEVHDPRGNVISRTEPVVLRRVIRPTTSALMRDLMEDVVANGTGRPAQVEGYRIGGKTGTTRKSDIFDRREYISSFGGAFPINDPRVVIYMYIDNPQGAYYASTVVAPSFRRVVRATALHLGIPPSADGVYRAREFASGMMNRDEWQGGHTSDLRERRAYIGRMPDLSGLTMSEARSLLPREARDVRFLGSGFVEDQFPSAGEPIGETTEIVLQFTTNAPAEGAVRRVETAQSLNTHGDTR